MSKYLSYKNVALHGFAATRCPEPLPRFLGTSTSEGLDSFIARMKAHNSEEFDTIDVTRVRHLYVTLPTRDGTLRSSNSSFQPCFPEAARPTSGDLLDPGHSLILFPSLVPLKDLSYDGTDPTYNLPSPYTRRMWAGGEFNFHEPKGYLGLKIGDLVKCVTTVPSIEVKKGGAMVFVDQLKKLSTERGLAITETRTHVFLPPVRTPRQTVAPSESPANTSTSQAFESSPDVSYTFIPTVSMLFRFSALTFNAHMIHLDPVFAREVDGHPERLVHGPLTSLLLLELASRLTPPGLGGLPAIKRYAYRAKHPIFVGRNLTLCGAYLPREATGGAITGTQLWAQNEQGTVCMTAEASFIVDV